MNIPKPLEKYLHIIFWTIIVAHIISWGILPAFIRHALTNDLIEAFSWGQHFDWGYDKNPWLPGFLAYIGIIIGGPSGIGIYLLQSLFVSLGLWSIWVFTSKISNSVYGLIAALILEMCSCYTVDVQIYNDNYILLGLLPFSILLFWQAITTEKIIYWISFSIILALATMGKYDAILLGVCFFIYLITCRDRLKYFLSYKPYLSFIIFLALISPNLIWLLHNSFSTISYAFYERAGFQLKSWDKHVINNLDFIQSIIVNYLLPFIVLCFAFTFHKNNLLVKSKQKSSSQMLYFLFWIALGPILLLLILGLVMGLSLHREWGSTFLGLIGTFILVYFQPNISLVSFTRFLVITFLMMILWPIGYSYYSIKNDVGNFPAIAITKIVYREWQSHFNSKLYYVAGDRYLAGYVALHASTKPLTWMDWNIKSNIDINDVKCKGAIFIQDNRHTIQQAYFGTTFPAFVLKLFPTLKVLPPINVPWYRNILNKPDLKLTIGLLAPDAQFCKTSSMVNAKLR